MKTKLICKHFQLFLCGNYQAAKYILELLITGRVEIRDTNDVAYASGVADFLLSNCRYHNCKSSFIAFL